MAYINVSQNLQNTAGKVSPAYLFWKKHRKLLLGIPFLSPPYPLPIASSCGTFLPKWDHEEDEGMNTFGPTPQITSQNLDYAHCKQPASEQHPSHSLRLNPREAGNFNISIYCNEYNSQCLAFSVATQPEKELNQSNI